MKHFALVALLGALIVGCGGAGDTSRLPSLYLGSWSGTWNSSDANDTGAISFTVATDGSMTGSITTKTGTGTLGGLIDKNGNLNAVASFTTGGNNMIIGGAVLMSSGRVSSNFSYVQMGVQYGGSFDCGAGSTTGTTGG